MKYEFLGEWPDYIALGVLKCEADCCHSILGVLTHAVLPRSGDVNGGRNGNNVSRTSLTVRMTAAPLSFSGLWLSYGGAVLNLLFWMHPTLNVKWWISLDFKPWHFIPLINIHFFLPPGAFSHQSQLKSQLGKPFFFIIVHLSMVPCILLKLWNHWGQGGNLLFGMVFNRHWVCVYSQNETTLLFFFFIFF